MSNLSHVEVEWFYNYIIGARDAEWAIGLYGMDEAKKIHDALFDVSPTAYNEGWERYVTQRELGQVSQDIANLMSS